MVPNLASMVETEEVRGITFATLFKETGVQHVDMVQIDAEGYDAELLRLFDVPMRKPEIVRFEHKHLSALAHKEAVASLVEQGYKLAISGSDTLAYLDLG